MTERRGGWDEARRLHAADDVRRAPEPADLRDAVETCVALSLGGLRTRALGTAVAEHLGIAPSAVDPEAVLSALGVLIASGRIDEVDGRLVPSGLEERRAG